MLWARCRGRAWWLLDWRKLRQCFLFIIEKVNLVIVYVAWGIHLNILKIWWRFWERDYTCACVYRMHLQLPEYWRGMDNDLSLLLTAQLKSFCLTSICPPLAPDFIPRNCHCEFWVASRCSESHCSEPSSSVVFKFESDISILVPVPDVAYIGC